jgi:hypothetical protein
MTMNMNQPATGSTNFTSPHFVRVPAIVMALVLFFISSLHSNAADSAVQVQLDSHKAAPRAVESLTERGVLRDYRIAWISLAKALESNTLDPLDGPFTEEAKRELADTIVSQQKFGLRQKYVNQNHQLETVFYAPEGDVIELHDTADCQLQIFDGDKLIQDEHVTLHYVVLMTPSADHWMVRHWQAVPHF